MAPGHHRSGHFEAASTVSGPAPDPIARMPSRANNCTTVHFYVYDAGLIAPREPPARHSPRVGAVPAIKGGEAGGDLRDAATARYDHHGRPDAGDGPRQTKRARKVADLMTTPVHTIRAEQSARAAAEQMDRRGCHHLPVLDTHDQLVGVLSDRDIWQHSHDSGGLESVRVESVMTREVITTHPNTSIRDAARAMVQWHISCLPVLTGPHELVGILTTGGLLRCIVHEEPLDLWI